MCTNKYRVDTNLTYMKMNEYRWGQDSVGSLPAERLWVPSLSVRLDLALSRPVFTLNSVVYYYMPNITNMAECHVPIFFKETYEKVMCGNCIVEIV